MIFKHLDSMDSCYGSESLIFLSKLRWIRLKYPLLLTFIEIFQKPNSGACRKSVKVLLDLHGTIGRPGQLWLKLRASFLRRCSVILILKESQLNSLDSNCPITAYGTMARGARSTSGVCQDRQGRFLGTSWAYATRLTLW